MYQEMAAHYGMAVIPARVRKPRDKAKVEAGELLVERWILAALRKRTFFSLAGLNQAIAFGRHLHEHESTWSQFNATDLRWDSTKSAIVDPEFDPMLVYFVAGVTFHWVS
jgi:transposase